MDGDYVLFNRQPSLHKMSMMGHRAKILPWSTFRLNLSATSPYNADFDGDEMNVHAVASVTGRTEMKMLSSVEGNYMNPQSSSSNMKVVQDSLLAMYLMTKKDVYISKGLFSRIITNADDFSFDFVQKKLLHIYKVYYELNKRLKYDYTGRLILYEML